MADNCPECGCEVQANAKLCIDCGFHFQRGAKISRGRVTESPKFVTDSGVEPVRPRTAGDNRAETNPYAPPASSPEGAGLTWELAESELPEVRKVAGGAMPILTSVALIPCVCFPVSTLLLPLSLYRLLQWWQLYQRFENLRSPNSLSPHVELELQFQRAFWQYAVSILLGICWLVFIVVVQWQ